MPASATPGYQFLQNAQKPLIYAAKKTVSSVLQVSGACAIFCTPHMPIFTHLCLPSGTTFNLRGWLLDETIFPSCSYDREVKMYMMDYGSDEQFEAIVTTLRELCQTWGFQIVETEKAD